MSLTAPEWLTNHGGELRSLPSGDALVVLVGGEPQYTLTAVPVGGKHGCRVVQTINGRRLDGPGTYSTVDEAVRGGLEDLRKALGW